MGSEAKHLSSSDKNREWLARPLQLQCLMLRGCLSPWNGHKMWSINIKYLLFQRYKTEPKFKMHHWLGNSSLLLAAIYGNREDIEVKVTKAIKGLYGTPSLWGGQGPWTPVSGIIRDFHEVLSTRLRQISFSLDLRLELLGLFILLHHAFFPSFSLWDPLLLSHPHVHSHLHQHFDKVTHTEV